MSETAQATELFEMARKTLIETEGRYGHESLVLADKLEEYALLLREHKGSMMEAFSAESRAKAIRTNFNRDKLWEDVAQNLRKRSSRERNTCGAQEPLICLIVSLVCGGLAALLGGMIGFSCGVLLASSTWLKCAQWRQNKLWVLGSFTTLGFSDIAYLFLHFKRSWMPGLLQIASSVLLSAALMNLPATSSSSPDVDTSLGKIPMSVGPED